ncbi:hypothetical protein QBC46DRAFT_153980 [Diplogelasinospora grovesii]|uniref:FAD-binding FR-type domain-containing protein n=1 Tax=Diplogelasinospora grovesii TaxID=303347 RepID=A0AAN6N5A1_9PEZI|nr:hypothetical protein QBC46DRAFT_153980 [Diplogelasinospora grovesii]
MALHIQSHGWHPGEIAVHSLLKVPTSRHENPTSAGLPPSYAHRVAVSPLVALGTIDEEGRPWTSIWGGERGFARPISKNILGLQSIVDQENDPVITALLGGKVPGEVVDAEVGEGKLMSGLSIDLETRDRVKLAGRMAVGVVNSLPPSKNGSTTSPVGQAQVAMHVEESLGNCPKYLNKKDIRPHIPSPRLAPSSPTLPADAQALIDKADMFFLSSTNGRTMDTNHRGGPPGFVRVVSNTEDSVVLVYPEYSGNQLYQTLGNLHLNPRVGMVIPDYETSDALYLTGETELLVGSAAAAFLPHTKVAVKVIVREFRFVKDGLSFRGSAGELSPYNPPARRLASECPASGQRQEVAPATATLVRKEILTPSIGRFTFKLHPERGRGLKAWKPGQHVTLDFSEELDQGYSHMRDDDPQSLNDDFVRTFTISNPPPQNINEVMDGTELQITVRRHGPATGLLWRHNIRAPLEIPVLGFGGEESFRIPIPTPDDNKQVAAVFVAGGVGITPLLAQALSVLPGGATPGQESNVEDHRETPLTLLWSLRAEDLPLALDTFQRIPGLAQLTHLFITGTTGPDSKRGDLRPEIQSIVGNVEEVGAKTALRRMLQSDLMLNVESSTRRKYYLCAGPELHKLVEDWLRQGEGIEVVSENFSY